MSTAARGHEAVLAVRGPGDILGEMAAMDGSPRSASAITLEQVTALWLITLRISRTDLAGLAATSREAVGRSLRDLRDAVIILSRHLTVWIL